MPEDYVGWPQRRDFPVGGEPVIFTYNEHEHPRVDRGQPMATPTDDRIADRPAPWRRWVATRSAAPRRR